MTKPRPEAVLAQDKTGVWFVKISLPDGTRIEARDGGGTGQKIVYDKVQRVPEHLKHNIVPKLMHEARTKNLRGE